MEYFKYLLEFPVLFLLLFMFLIIKNRDKLVFLLPNNKKELERLLKSKELNDKYNQNETELNTYLVNEIRRRNFYNATRLRFSHDNIKLLEHYKGVSNEMSLEEYKKISRYLKGNKTLKKINLDDSKITYTLSLSFWAFAFLISFMLIVFFSRFYTSIGLKELNLIALYYITLISSAILFQYVRDERKLMRKYNSILEELQESDCLEQQITKQTIDTV